MGLNMKVYIYGAGDKGRHAFRRIEQFYNDQVEVAGFIDGRKSGTYLGLPIISAENVCTVSGEKDIPIVIAVASRKAAVDIYTNLLQKGEGKLTCYFYLAKDNDTYGPEDFFSYECKLLADDAKEMIPHIEIHAADYCNLNCSGCIHFSPIYKRELPNTEKRLADIDKICSVSNKILSFYILGGEPLLNPELAIYLKKARDLLPNADIQLVTNGLLIPHVKKELMEAIKENNIVVTISEYEPTYCIRSKIITRLKEYKIDYAIRQYDRKQKFNLPLTVNLNSCYDNICISDGCVNIKEGKIARCPTLLYIKELNDKFHADFPQDGIYDLNEFQSCEELNEKMKEKVSLCRYCIKKEIDWHICKGTPCFEDFVSYE